MDTVLNCCAIIHNMIVKHRDLEGTMKTKNIVSADTNAIVVSVKRNLCFNFKYNEAYLSRESADPVNARNVYEMLTNALAYST